MVRRRRSEDVAKYNISKGDEEDWSIPINNNFEMDWIELGTNECKVWKATEVMLTTSYRNSSQLRGGPRLYGSTSA